MNNETNSEINSGINSGINNEINDDPFCVESDPDYRTFSMQHAASTEQQSLLNECHCVGQEKFVTRRSALVSLSALSMIPMQAIADPFLLPCKQSYQRIRPCHHKFCKHFGGGEDYYKR